MFFTFCSASERLKENAKSEMVLESSFGVAQIASTL